MHAKFLPCMRLALIIWMLGMLLMPAQANAMRDSFAQDAIIHYVKWDADGANDGSSWSNAYTDLQSALAAASTGDAIWVAAGTYKPTTGTDRSVSFVLTSGVSLVGGFAGTETNLSQRDLGTNPTVLSGNIGVEAVSDDNSYHVVVASNTDDTMVLDGFTIRDGSASDGTAHASANNMGGGLLNVSGDLVLRSVTFSNNMADYGGGGMANDDHASPTMEDVTFSDNATDNYGGGLLNQGSSTPKLSRITFQNNMAISGGGMANLSSSSPTLENVKFHGNSAHPDRGSGGGLYNFFSTVTLSRVTFDQNTGGSGGGMASLESTITLTDGTFTENTASSGGGISNGSSTVTLTNVTLFKNTGGEGGGLRNHNSPLVFTNGTLVDNSAEYGGGVYLSWEEPVLINLTFRGNTADHGDGIYIDDSGPQITNTILWEDGIEASNIESQTPSLTTSVLQSGCPAQFSCTGTITDDPLLGGLQDNGGFTQTLALSDGSPAIDAGTDTGCPSTDQRGVTRPQGSHCDIGAYERETDSFPATPTFPDVPTNHPYYHDVEILFANGLTAGCNLNPRKYCPDDIMNRAQAAVFMLRGSLGADFIPGPATHKLQDNWSSGIWAEPWAEAMYDNNLSAGCSVSPLKFCPWAPVPREQMVIFALRLKYGIDYTPPPAAGTLFADMTNSNYYATSWAEQAYKDGLIPQCGTSAGKPMFCPKSPVTLRTWPRI